MPSEVILKLWTKKVFFRGRIVQGGDITLWSTGATEELSTYKTLNGGVSTGVFAALSLQKGSRASREQNLCPPAVWSRKDSLDLVGTENQENYWAAPPLSRAPYGHCSTCFNISSRVHIPTPHPTPPLHSRNLPSVCHSAGELTFHFAGEPTGSPKHTNAFESCYMCNLCGGRGEYWCPKPFLLFKDLTFQRFMSTGALLQIYSQNSNAQTWTYYFALILTCVYIRIYWTLSLPKCSMALFTLQLARSLQLSHYLHLNLEGSDHSTLGQLPLQSGF